LAVGSSHFHPAITLEYNVEGPVLSTWVRHLHILNTVGPLLTLVLVPGLFPSTPVRTGHYFIAHAQMSLTLCQSPFIDTN
jgi:hypothetical protein